MQSTYVTVEQEVARLYTVAKAGRWEEVALALAGEAPLAAWCARYVREPSGWTFLHQASYVGNEGAVRALVRLGATADRRSAAGETPAAVAEKRGHVAVAALLQRAADTGSDLWAPRGAELGPSSRAFSEARERRVPWRVRVGYGGGVVDIPPARRHYVDSFGRVLVGFHGTYDPPSGMEGSSLVPR